MENTSRIKCPNCHHEIDVQDVLAHQVEEKIRIEYQSKLESEKQVIEQQAANLQKEKEEFLEAKKKEKELFQQKLEDRLKAERSQLETKLKTRIQEEQAEQLKSLQEELNEKTGQVKELNRFKADIERLKREKEELKESIEAEAQRTINQKISEEKDRKIGRASCRERV